MSKKDKETSSDQSMIMDYKEMSSDLLKLIDFQHDYINQIKGEMSDSRFRVYEFLIYFISGIAIGVGAAYIIYALSQL